METTKGRCLVNSVFAKPKTNFFFRKWKFFSHSRLTNVTSPTGMRMMNRMYDLDLAVIVKPNNDFTIE